MSINTSILALITLVSLSGCVNTPEAKQERAFKIAKKTSFEQRPALYAKLEREGQITPEVRQQWDAAWSSKDKQLREQQIAYDKEVQRQQVAYAKQRKKQAEEQSRMWASLSPRERLDFQMREREMQQRESVMQQQQSMMSQQAEQQRRADRQAIYQSFSDNLQRQQEINAYNARTSAMTQPTNVNVNATINHNINQNVNGTIYHRYPYQYPYYGR